MSKHVLCALCVLCPLYGIIYFIANKNKNEDRANHCLTISVCTIVFNILLIIYLGNFPQIAGSFWGFIIYLCGIGLVRCVCSHWADA